MTPARLAGQAGLLSVRSLRRRQRERRGLGGLHRRQGNGNKGGRASGDGRFLGRPRRRFQPQHVDFSQHRRASLVGGS
jgi:hypothetical protein